jgi:uncharacterized phage-associated protein
MRHDSRAVANYFIQKAGENARALTPMQVIKLVYFAHGWSLGIYGDPLIDDEVEAWEYGPVIRSVYDAFKRFGNQPITSPAMDGGFKAFYEGKTKPINSQFSKKEKDLLNKVWEIYGKLKGFQLSEITHSEDSPWCSTFNKEGRNSIILDDKIRKYFNKQAVDNKSKKSR